MKNKFKQNKQEGSRRSSQNQVGILKFGGLPNQRRMAQRTEASQEKVVDSKQLLGKVSEIEQRLSLNNLRVKEDFRLRNSTKYLQQWTKIDSAIKKKTNQVETLIEKSEWEARRKNEVSRIIDLSKNLNEKYGYMNGWQYGLRYDAKDGPLRYKVSCTTKGQQLPISALLIDDRSTPVTVIRKPLNLYSKDPYSEPQSSNQLSYRSVSKSAKEQEEYSFGADKSILKRGISQK